jgi:hypothetical protein
LWEGWGKVLKINTDQTIFYLPNSKKLKNMPGQ